MFSAVHTAPEELDATVTVFLVLVFVEKNSVREIT